MKDRIIYSVEKDLAGPDPLNDVTALSISRTIERICRDTGPGIYIPSPKKNSCQVGELGPKQVSWCWQKGWLDNRKVEGRI